MQWEGGQRKEGQWVEGRELILNRRYPGGQPARPLHPAQQRKTHQKGLQHTHLVAQALPGFALALGIHRIDGGRAFALGVTIDLFAFQRVSAIVDLPLTIAVGLVGREGRERGGGTELVHSASMAPMCGRHASAPVALKWRFPLHPRLSPYQAATAATDAPW